MENVLLRWRWAPIRHATYTQTETTFLHKVGIYYEGKSIADECVVVP